MNLQAGSADYAPLLQGDKLPEDVRDAALAAYELAARATCLDQLRAAVDSFNGCVLRQTAQHTVFCDGNPNAEIMLIGEAPGAQEDEQGRPFVGRSGQLLDKMLGEAGLLRAENVYITNVLFWRPPDNRTPTPHELTICRAFVERHIALMQPKILLFVGGTSAKFMLKSEVGITHLRGKWHNYTNVWLNEPVAAMPTYHPSYLLRSPTKKEDVWQDLLRVKQKAAELGVKI